MVPHDVVHESRKQHPGSLPHNPTREALAFLVVECRVNGEPAVSVLGRCDVEDEFARGPQAARRADTARSRGQPSSSAAVPRPTRTSGILYRITDPTWLGTPWIRRTSTNRRLRNRALGWPNLASSSMISSSEPRILITYIRSKSGDSPSSIPRLDASRSLSASRFSFSTTVGYRPYSPHFRPKSTSNATFLSVTAAPMRTDRNTP